MPNQDYIPTPDADFDAWLTNFSTLATAAPATYGLTAPNAVVIAAQQAAFNAAFLTATTPATRTSPTIAAKDAARATAEAVVRPFAVEVSMNAAVADLDKAAIGVTIRKVVPTPIPPPLTFPTLTLVAAQPLQHALSYRDSATPTTKSKPFGAIGMQLFRYIGVAPTADPALARFFDQWTKSPNVSTFDAGDMGKWCTYFARWVTRGGPNGTVQYGPWSAPLSLGVM